MSDHDYTFLIAPQHLAHWAEMTRLASDGTSLPIERVAEMLLDTVFLVVYHTETSHLPARHSVKCRDSSITDGERSVEMRVFSH